MIKCIRKIDRITYIILIASKKIVDISDIKNIVPKKGENKNEDNIVYGNVDIIY